MRCPSRCETKRNYLNCRKFVNEPDTPQEQVPSSAPNGKDFRVSVEATWPTMVAEHFSTTDGIENHNKRRQGLSLTFIFYNFIVTSS